MKAFSIDFEEAEKLEKEWVFEIKYDGVRQLFINGKLFSEFGVDNTQKFKHIRDEFKGDRCCTRWRSLSRERELDRSKEKGELE